MSFIRHEGKWKLIFRTSRDDFFDFPDARIGQLS
jgi:hypothetical protein